MIRAMLALFLLAPSTAGAQIEALFFEGAPTDTFTFTNKGCALGTTQVQLDMTESAGGLIFDTEDGGAGVEVFQPFQSVSGQIASVEVGDGAQILKLEVPSWPEGGELSFTIDVDDVLRHGDLGQIQVSGGEIAGAELRIITEGLESFGVFDTTRRAIVRGVCTS